MWSSHLETYGFLQLTGSLLPNVRRKKGTNSLISHIPRKSEDIRWEISVQLCRVRRPAVSTWSLVLFYNFFNWFFKLNYSNQPGLRKGYQRNEKKDTTSCGLLLIGPNIRAPDRRKEQKRLDNRDRTIFVCHVTIGIFDVRKWKLRLISKGGRRVHGSWISLPIGENYCNFSSEQISKRLGTFDKDMLGTSVFCLQIILSFPFPELSEMRGDRFSHAEKGIKN